MCREKYVKHCFVFLSLVQWVNKLQDDSRIADVSEWVDKSDTAADNSVATPAGPRTRASTATTPSTTAAPSSAATADNQCAGSQKAEHKRVLFGSNPPPLQIAPFYELRDMMGAAEYAALNFTKAETAVAEAESQEEMRQAAKMGITVQEYYDFKYSDPDVS